MINFEWITLSYFKFTFKKEKTFTREPLEFGKKKKKEKEIVTSNKRPETVKANRRKIEEWIKTLSISCQWNVFIHKQWILEPKIGSKLILSISTGYWKLWMDYSLSFLAFLLSLTRNKKNFNWVMLHYNGSMAHYWHSYPQSLRISHFSLQILMNASKLKSARSLKYINFLIYTLYYVLEISQIEY